MLQTTATQKMNETRKKKTSLKINFKQTIILLLDKRHGDNDAREQSDARAHTIHAMHFECIALSSIESHANRAFCDYFYLALQWPRIFNVTIIRIIRKLSFGGSAIQN